MKKTLFNNPIFILIIILSLVIMACGGGTTVVSQTTTGSSSATTAQTDASQSDTSSAQTAATATAAPEAKPEPWDREQVFMDSLSDGWSQMQFAVTLPYGGNSPDSTECGDFWSHQLNRHIGGDAASQHSASEILNFLSAVAEGRAEIVKVAVRAGGGIVALFRHAGGQWLFFLGDGLNPSAYKPLSHNAVRSAINGSQIYKYPPNALKSALQTGARCFRENAPQEVRAQAEVTVPISQFYGTYDFASAPTPVIDVTATPPVMVPVPPMGSYGMAIPFDGTPPAFAMPSDYVYSASHAVYYYSPEGGFGLTPMEMVECSMGLVVVAVIFVTAELWLPVVVAGAPAAASLAPAFAP